MKVNGSNFNPSLDWVNSNVPNKIQLILSKCSSCQLPLDRAQRSSKHFSLTLFRCVFEFVLPSINTRHFILFLPSTISSSPSKFFLTGRYTSNRFYSLFFSFLFCFTLIAQCIHASMILIKIRTASVAFTYKSHILMHTYAKYIHTYIFLLKKGREIKKIKNKLMTYDALWWWAKIVIDLRV